METVYGTKKYFQSLSGNCGNSDIYRSSTCRAVTNDYSYQNTFGRGSTIGPYQHMNKQHPTYSTDLSVSSQYGYNTWGIWRDQTNLAPSIYSTKSRKNYMQSFSIILSTAAFIVILAVISIAGLAFYFGTFKTSLDDSIIVFDGKFLVLKGDIYTTGLKYNHTSTYKQKVDYYKRFVERSLLNNGLNPIKIEVIGFGDGPLIEARFRTYLDTRKMPPNINSVEEHIKESILLEINSLKSTYKSIKIDPNSINIKRIFGEEHVKSASFSNESMPSNSQSYFEKRLTNKSGIVEKSNIKLKTSTTTTPISKTKTDDEPEVDVENAPVIQGSFEGSFEITKTDADITRKKTIPTRAVTTHSKSSVSITPQPIRVVNKKTTIEKVEVRTHFSASKLSPQDIAATKKLLNKTEIQTINVTTTTSNPITTTSSTSSTSSTTVQPTDATTTVVVPAVVVNTENVTVTTASTTITNEDDSTTENIPKDDLNQNHQNFDKNSLNSIPILDNSPWRPIQPIGLNRDDTASENKPSIFFNTNTMPNIPEMPKLEATEPEILPRNKIRYSDPMSDNPNDMLFYNSFMNPVFIPGGSSGIERLGNSPVRPHDLPLSLLDHIVIPAFKPLQTQLPLTNGPLSELQTNLNKMGHSSEENDFIKTFADIENIAKTQQILKNDPALSPPIDTTEKYDVADHVADPVNPLSLPIIDDIAEQTTETSLTDIVSPSTEASDKVGAFLFDLINNVPKDEFATPENKNQQIIESDIKASTESVLKPNFLNLKDIILNQNKLSNKTDLNLFKHDEIGLKKEPNLYQASSTNRNYINSKEPSQITIGTMRTTPSTIDDSMLFRTNTKWEFQNESYSGPASILGQTKKVFNETLQAWVVENDDKHEDLIVPATAAIANSQEHRNNNSHIQDISLIFDTLASKLGISLSIPMKNPPFSHSKLKQTQRNDMKNRDNLPWITTQPTTTQQSTVSGIDSQQKTSDEELEYSDGQVETKYDAKIIEMLTGNNSASNLQSENIGDISNLVPDIIEGEAEIEIIDPNKYEEMLKFSQSLTSSTESTPILVTLLPVKSNSGVRASTFKPQITAKKEKDSFSTPKLFPETIVKTGIQVTV